MNTTERHPDIILQMQRTKVGARVYQYATNSAPVAVAVEHITPDSLNHLLKTYGTFCKICVMYGNKNTMPCYRACMAHLRPDKRSVIFVGICRLRHIKLTDEKPYLATLKE